MLMVLVKSNCFQRRAGLIDLHLRSLIVITGKSPWADNNIQDSSLKGTSFVLLFGKFCLARHFM